MWNLLTSELGIRLGCFLGVLVVMATWEMLAPRRRLAASKSWRWLSNLGLVVVNSVVVRIVAPFGVVGVALLAESRGWGLFNNLTLPYGLAVALCVVVMDFAVYLQHVMFHAVPLLWRFHMVHHADLDFDVTTGLRFHTIEILLSLAIKAAVVLLIGPPVSAVIIFEVLLNATSMFNHGNVRMPIPVDRLLRWLVVTPDMHRVHHSTVVSETNSNFGFNLSWWDYLLGTYRDQPGEGHSGMSIGLSQFREEHRVERLHHVLLLPFTGHPGD
jgi:sterol desaturase/sphingolipid hydroxylase (fatty acid hydroxylase superfamily)